MSLYDQFLGTKVDMDSERGMHQDDQYYLLDKEIRERLTVAGFKTSKRGTLLRNAFSTICLLPGKDDSVGKVSLRRKAWSRR